MYRIIDSDTQSGDYKWLCEGICSNSLHIFNLFDIKATISKSDHPKSGAVGFHLHISAEILNSLVRNLVSPLRRQVHLYVGLYRSKYARTVMSTDHGSGEEGSLFFFGHVFK